MDTSPDQSSATIGAASLASGSKDAGLLLYLEPGVYSVHVRRVNDTTGIALVEVYEVTDQVPVPACPQIFLTVILRLGEVSSAPCAVTCDPRSRDPSLRSG